LKEEIPHHLLFMNTKVKRAKSSLPSTNETMDALIGCQGGTTMTKIAVIVITFHPDAANLDTMLCVKRLTELQESCSSVFQQKSLDRRSKRQHQLYNGTNSVEMATKSHHRIFVSFNLICTLPVPAML